MTMVATDTTYSTRPGDHDIARLVARAADGDQLVWKTLVDRFSTVLRAVTRAHRLSDADAADVTQCTWMRLVENLDRINDPARLSAWLTTTARRECLGTIRRTMRTIPHGDDLPETPSDDSHPGERLNTQQRDLALHAAIHRLHPRHRVLLRMLSSYPTPSYQQIGSTLGMAVGSIGPTRTRALEHLRREVTRAGPSPQSGTERENGRRAEITALVGLSTWPARTTVIGDCERAQ